VYFNGNRYFETHYNNFFTWPVGQPYYKIYLSDVSFHWYRTIGQTLMSRPEYVNISENISQQTVDLTLYISTSTKYWLPSTRLGSFEYINPVKMVSMDAHFTPFNFMKIKKEAFSFGQGSVNNYLLRQEIFKIHI
jgi:hypothetical protein